MIANSGHDENGRYTGGKAGDQTGTEWYVRSWYDYPYGGWGCILRHPDKKVRKMIAKLAKAAANNDKIGYDQGQRETFWLQLKTVNYDPAKITKKCEADCSSGVAAIVKAAGYKLNIVKVATVPATMWTGSMKSYLKEAGFQVKTASYYRNSEDYLLEGDILLNEKNHTCINLTNGKKTVAWPVDYLYRDVKNKPQVKKLQKCLNKLIDADLEVDGLFGPLTLKAVKRFQKKYSLEVDGIVGKYTRAKIKELVA